LFVVIGLIGTLIAWNSELMLMIIALGYLVSGVLARLAYGWGRRSRRRLQTAESANVKSASE
jgi:CDP-diacylglycerol--serine O-phosphatidyltransferase